MELPINLLIPLDQRINIAQQNLASCVSFAHSLLLESGVEEGLCLAIMNKILKEDFT